LSCNTGLKSTSHNQALLPYQSMSNVYVYNQWFLALVSVARQMQSSVKINSEQE